MSISLYMDHHVPKAITIGLRLREIDVLTSFEDGTGQLGDDLLLKRANELKRTLFTQDDDLLEEAAKCQRAGTPFSGVIYGHQLRVTIGVCIQDLEIIAKSAEPEELQNQVFPNRHHILGILPPSNSGQKSEKYRHVSLGIRVG